MIFNSAFLPNLGLGLEGSIPEIGDTDLNIPPLLSPVIEPIYPTLRVVGTGAADTASVNVGVQQQLTNVSTQNLVLMTFIRGLFDIFIDATVRINYAAGAGGGPIYQVDLLNPALGAANPIVNVYADIGQFHRQRKIRLFFAQAGWVLRTTVFTLLAGQNVDHSTNVQINRIL